MGFQAGSSSGQQSSSGYGYNNSLAQSINQSTQNIWGPQAQALSGLYGQASSLLGSQGNMQQAAQNQVNKLMPGAMAGMAGAQSIAGGGGPLAQYAQPNNALAAQQLSDMSANIGQNFNRNILTGLNSNANMAGGLGGSRDALARGVAAGDASQAIAQAGTNLYGQQYGIGAQAAQGQANAMLQAAGQLPGMASSIYNMGMMPSQAAWAPLTSAASIFGGPTVLGQSYALSQAQSQAQNWAQSQGTQKSSDLGFKFFG